MRYHLGSELAYFCVFEPELSHKVWPRGNIKDCTCGRLVKWSTGVTKAADALPVSECFGESFS
jgi:hypothetical protein